MKKLFNFLPLMALVFGLGLTLIMSSFKGESGLTPPADGWYTVFITNTGDAENEAEQEITSTEPLEGEDVPPSVDALGCAQTLNTGFKCAVYLDFESTATAVPATVDDVNGTDVNITATARQPL